MKKTNYIKCRDKDCKKIGFNDDDSVCVYCGSKATDRVWIKMTARMQEDLTVRKYN